MAKGNYIAMNSHTLCTTTLGRLPACSTPILLVMDFNKKPHTQQLRKFEDEKDQRSHAPHLHASGVQEIMSLLCQ